MIFHRFLEHPHQQNQMMVPQQQPMIRVPLMPSTSTPAPTSTTPTQDRSGSAAVEHTNLMERTREDELLGTNATMSNVLYCNVNHPDLKQQFPGKKISFISCFFNSPNDSFQSFILYLRVSKVEGKWIIIIIILFMISFLLFCFVNFMKKRNHFFSVKISMNVLNK